MTHFNLFFKSLYNSIYIRIFIGFISWFINVKILKKLKHISTDKSVSGTITHNISVLRKFPLTDFTMQRMERLLCSVKAIETVSEESEILMIGPRTESDIFKLFGLFPKSKITGVDLISYSKHIQLGDAHELEFNDNKFDVTISGWVISYTKTPMEMISEMIRVTKSEGIISIGFEHIDDLSNEYVKTMKDKHVNIHERYLNCLEDIKTILKELNMKFKSIFEYDALLKNKSVEEKYRLTKSHSSQVLFTFQILKD